MRNYLKYIIILFLPLIAYAQSRDEQMQKGIDYIYHIKFDSATAIFQNLVNKNPDDPTGYFMLAMTEWWRIYINKDDESNDDNYLSKVDKCLQVCDKRIDENKNDDWAIFLKGGVIGYRGFLNSIRDNWLKAADDGKEGLSLIQRAYELNPNNKDAVFGIGLYNYAADYVTEKYSFLKALLFFFPKGNKELGLSQIKDCAENAKFSKTEANFVLCYVNLNYEKNYIESEKYADKISKMYPENPMALRFLAKSYVGENKWNESLNIWKDMLFRNDSNKIGFNTKYTRREALYYIGLSTFKLNNLDESIKNYEMALNMSKELDKDGESAYQVFSALGLGMIYDLKNDHSKAVKYYNMVLDMKDVESSHETAKTFIDKGFR